jgi:hypothetical protein
VTTRLYLLCTKNSKLHIYETVPLTQDPEKGFVVKAGTLGFSVTVYTLFAILGLALLLARRFLGIFGSAELGGNNGRDSFILF